MIIHATFYYLLLLVTTYAAFVSSRVASGSDKACARAEAMSIVKEFAEFKKTL